MTRPPRPDRLPGDPDAKERIDRIIRVNQAGEFGAKRIYQGQLAVLGDDALIRDMLAQEERHLERFNALVAERGVRPTALEPLWNIAGFALGAATAALGPKAAHACTVAVEDVIGEHYAAQAKTLADDADPSNQALKDTIVAFRDDELRHREQSLAAGAEQAPAYPVLTGAVKAATKLAIWLSTRV